MRTFRLGVKTIGRKTGVAAEVEPRHRCDLFSQDFIITSQFEIEEAASHRLNKLLY